MERKSKIALTETELKKIISESIKQTICELDWKTVDNAAHKANYTYDFDMLDYEYDQFEESARKFMKALYRFPQGSDLAEELEMFLIDAKKLCERKTKQASSLEQHANDSFMRKFGKNKNDMEKHIYDLYDEHGSDNMEDNEWRRNNLSPEENEFYDNN